MQPEPILRWSTNNDFHFGQATCAFLTDRILGQKEMLTKRQEEALKRHAAHHTSKHMAFMRKHLDGSLVDFFHYFLPGEDDGPSPGLRR